MFPKPLEGKHPLVMNNGGKQYWKLLQVASGEGTLACRVVMLGAGKREMERGSWQDYAGLCFCVRPKKVWSGTCWGEREGGKWGERTPRELLGEEKAQKQLNPLVKLFLYMTL